MTDVWQSIHEVMRVAYYIFSIMRAVSTTSSKIGAPAGNIFNVGGCAESEMWGLMTGISSDAMSRDCVTSLPSSVHCKRRE